MRLADLPNDGSQHKEIYAFFGLAMYQASVFEVAVANAIVPFKLAMEQGAFATRESFHEAFDREMASQFQRGLGDLLKTLGKVHTLPKELGGQFHRVLDRRNFLAHHFFREHAETFYSVAGREEMLGFIQSSIAMFEQATDALANFLQPKLDAVGLTKARLAEEFRIYLQEVRDKTLGFDDAPSVEDPE